MYFELQRFFCSGLEKLTNTPTAKIQRLVHSHPLSHNPDEDSLLRGSKIGLRTPGDLPPPPETSLSSTALWLLRIKNILPLSNLPPICRGVPLCYWVPYRAAQLDLLFNQS